MTTPPNLAQSMAEEIANEIVLHGSDGDLVERLSGATEIIQRRIEPLVGSLESCLHELKHGPSDRITRAAIIDVAETLFSQIERKENEPCRPAN